LTRSKVCATQKTECTIRPTFISSGEKKQYVAYQKYDESNIVADTKNVFRLLFNESNDASSVGLRVAQEGSNIDDFVKDAQNRNFDHLFTSFTLDSSYSDFNSKFAGKKVVFVDMPGDNGREANEQFDSFYNLLLKRTDLVLFLFKDDIDVSVDKYLSFIIKHNKKIPFIQILNKIDNLRPKPEKDQETLDQLEQCKNKLLKKGIDVKKSFVLNVDAVSIFLNGEETVNVNLVNSRYSDYVEFEKFLNSEYFCDNKIKETVLANFKSRFRDQLEVMSFNMDEKIKALSEARNAFETQIADIKNINLSSFEINEEIQKRKQVNCPEIDQYAENYDNDRVFKKVNFIKKIQEYKERYLDSNYLNDIQRYWDCCKRYMREKINDRFAKSIDIEDNLDITRDDIQSKEIFTEGLYRNCKPRFVLGYYDSGDLKKAIIDFYKKMYNQDLIRKVAQAKFDLLKVKYVETIQEQVFPKRLETLLAVLKELRTKLS